MHRLEFVDSHTGGEPTRVVLSGFPDLGAGPLADRAARLTAQHDRWRRAVVGEPRSSDVVVGAVLTPPLDPTSAAAVIFFNNAGTLGMCGHGTIGLVETLQFLGRIRPGVHRIETPAGTVSATLHPDRSVSVDNVVSWRHAADVELQVPGMGRVVGDVAWGGNWFFLVRAPNPRVAPDTIDALMAQAEAIRRALDASGVRGADGHVVDHIELFCDSPTPGCHSRNFVLCPGLEYDRSPCGTGTSAKLACLAADGALQPGQAWRQESVIGSTFDARFRWETTPTSGRIIPTITGRAFVCARGELLVDPDDAFGFGIPARDDAR
ncbi:MAG: proline racemase family protein [Betaproteobacteria bacterium]|nr:proline racemase family protein [Betaproteobacteria bacterium]